MPKGYPNRAAEVQSDRRRKRGGTQAGKLAVPEEMLDRDNFAYRWANDKDNRLSDLTQNDDWTIVRAPATEGEGTPVTRNVGTHEGKPLKAYLIQKPKDYFEADHAERLRPVNELENEIRRGGTAHLKSEEAGDTGGLYTPGGRNTIDGR